MHEKKEIIDASPTKGFFVNMLTKDIGLGDCILDLVDNSIDSWVRRSSVDVMKILLEGGATAKLPEAEPATIFVTMTDTDFCMQDTCGGITVDEAKNFVFRFGLPDDKPEKMKGTGLSVYGIGMKRAFFKLGRLIRLTSASEGREFEVIIDVEDWRKREEWNLEFSYIRDLKKSDRVTAGTTIKIERLNEGIGQRLILDSFKNVLERRIGSTYALFLKKGIKIVVNGTEIKGQLPEIARSDEISYVWKSFSHDGVDILIVAGLTSTEDRIPRGWYVFCNGRMVLEANKDHLTGWGENFPAFHSKYNHFIGYLYFRSEDVNALPWKTTKEGIEKESPVYQYALNEMQILAKPITNFLNRKYPGEISPDGIFEKKMHEDAQPMALDMLPKRESIFRVQPKPRKQFKVTTIIYKKLIEEVDRVKKHIGKPNMSNKELGEYTFDYFVEKEC